jgi:hypothetical protein
MKFLQFCTFKKNAVNFWKEQQAREKNFEGGGGGDNLNFKKPHNGGPMQTSKMGENGFSELGEMLHISRKDGE